MNCTDEFKIMSAEIEKAVSDCSDVLIMGHKYSDSDCVGSAVGMLKLCSDFGKQAKIVISVKSSLATPLLSHLKKKGIDNYFVSTDEAVESIGDGTLLIIVDTHRAVFLESTELYERAKKVIVIDHHERSSDFIENALVVCHDQNASSASELVTKIIAVSERAELTPVYANALLAGIMLDTKDFMLRTTADTFECAAVLRMAGADTAAVKHFFNNSLKMKKLKGKIMLAAYEYSNCAISVAEVTSDNIRIISAQAADELLMVNDVEASFVLFMTGDTLNISARSKGKVNVREIMESFSGGGHQTMAACQLQGADVKQVRRQLEERIDEYFRNL